MTDPKLKPCPFCGAAPTPTARKEGLVWCSQCPVGRTPVEWNRRANAEVESAKNAAP